MSEIGNFNVLDDSWDYITNITNPCAEIPLYPTVQCPCCKGYRKEYRGTSMLHGKGSSYPANTGRISLCKDCLRDEKIDVLIS